MTNQFFNIFTQTPWDGQNTNQLTQVKLLSLKSVFESFPVIEKKFFNDLSLNTSRNTHYSWNLTIKRISGPSDEDYDISKFNFVWAMDDQRRMFQFLFQKISEKNESSQSILVALAPPELAKLFATHESKAIIRTLSLLNNPEKIRFLMILGPKGKSIAEDNQLFQFAKDNIEERRYTDFLTKFKNLPNIQGQWFPTAKSRCPVCGYEISVVQNTAIASGVDFVCPQCGYEKMKFNK